LWLKAPIVQAAKSKGEMKEPIDKDNDLGTPQGGVISPLLANIYMHLLDRIINNPQSYYAQTGMQMIRYADDFILMAPTIAQSTLDRVHALLERMELSINEQKSRLVNAKETPFDFLGFTIRYSRSILYQGGYFWNIFPKKKSELKIRENIRMVLKKAGHFAPSAVVQELNPIIQGWMNYYHIPKVSQTQLAFRRLDEFLRSRLFRYYRRKSQRKSKLYGHKAYELLTKNYGLIVPYKTSGILPVFAH
jgi:retron-type reverse transcriptase